MASSISGRQPDEDNVQRKEVARKRDQPWLISLQAGMQPPGRYSISNHYGLRPEREGLHLVLQLRIQGQLKLDMRQVPHAMQFAGYTIDKDLLNRLFGSENAKGKRSAKKLRDAVTHGIEQAAVDEIITRQDQLFKDMNDFLEIIRKV